MNNTLYPHAINARVDLNNLRHNLQQITNLAPQSKSYAVLKSNAYGHGVLPCANALKNHTYGFAFARLNETLEVLHLHKPTLILEGFFDANELQFIAENNLESMIHSDFQIELLGKTALKNPIIVWLKIDSGMHRLGFYPEQVFEKVEKLMAVASDKISEIRFASHFACADELENPYTNKQLNSFNLACANFNFKRSICASSGILYHPKAHFDFIRPGIALYGIAPGKMALPDNFNSVMSLSCSILSLKNIKTGEGVGYGQTWRTAKNSQIAIITSGYGDGITQNMQNCELFLHDQPVKTIGKVAMDMMTIEIPPQLQNKVKIGDQVVFFDQKHRIEKLSEACKTNNYALTTQLTRRVNYTYIGA